MICKRKNLIEMKDLEFYKVLIILFFMIKSSFPGCRGDKIRQLFHYSSENKPIFILNYCIFPFSHYTIEEMNEKIYEKIKI
jgi:hypothetical protein